jgi:hypothetical protein
MKWKKPAERPSPAELQKRTVAHALLLQQHMGLIDAAGQLIGAGMGMLETEFGREEAIKIVTEAAPLYRKEGVPSPH